MTLRAGAPAEPLPPGYAGLGYIPPSPGSYALPSLGKAADGQVLTIDGTAARLHGFYGDKIVLLSFIYTSCSDVAGCPLATAVLQQIRDTITADPLLTDHLRLVTLSFDPVHDTPAVMQRYRANLRADGTDWHFLTTRSELDLGSILIGYNQAVQREYDDEGKFLGTFSHILRVFLVDRDRRIRNVYSASFLHKDLLINDVKTLLIEDDAPFQRVDDSGGTLFKVARVTRPGDYKGGYESHDYETQSLSLVRRQGEEADLVGLVNSPPLGLPPVPVPADNPITAEKIALGRQLFFDRRLSLNDTFSCAMCHIPEQGFTSNELATAVGIEGRTVRRNAPTVYNVGYMKRLFHDAREHTLEQQIWAPMLAKNEMGNPSIGAVIDKIRRMPDYRGLFEEAFAGKGPTMETIGMAIASYERALLSGRSPFDRWYYGNESDALTESAARGFKLFAGKGGCVACHVIEQESALFTDHLVHNTGVGYHASMQKEPDRRDIVVAPGVVFNVARDTIESVSEKKPNDLGLYEVTQNPGDRWKYRTPSLRNVALTAPYMHDGSLGTLKEVVEFYNRGGIQNELRDPLIRPLNLSAREQSDLIAFLESLTGDNVELLVSDAFAAPIGDLTEDDPHWTHESAMGR